MSGVRVAGQLVCEERSSLLPAYPLCGSQQLTPVSARAKGWAEAVPRPHLLILYLPRLTHVQHIFILRQVCLAYIQVQRHTADCRDLEE